MQTYQKISSAYQIILMTGSLPLEGYVRHYLACHSNLGILNKSPSAIPYPFRPKREEMYLSPLHEQDQV